MTASTCIAAGSGTSLRGSAPRSRRLVAAARLILPLDATLSGRTAAWVLGAAILREAEPIEITVPRGRSLRPRQGIDVWHAALPPSHVTVPSKLRITTAARTAFDLAR